MFSSNVSTSVQESAASKCSSYFHLTLTLNSAVSKDFPNFHLTIILDSVVSKCSLYFHLTLMLDNAVSKSFPYFHLTLMLDKFNFIYYNQSFSVLLNSINTHYHIDSIVSIMIIR